jgi:crotonobetainyl-CoA:carnitine CoA-transferase CaiB-like acyl-CoA transferase
MTEVLIRIARSKYGNYGLNPADIKIDHHGRYMAVGAVEGKFWKTLCEHLEIPQYVNLQYDEARKEEIIESFRHVFRRKTMVQWEQEFSQMDVCISSIRNLNEVLEEPLLKEREMVVALPGASGKHEKVLGVPVKLSETPGSVQTPSISFGANTEAILKEYGYSDDQIRHLAEVNVI